ncbi:unnamed protein product [Polarella glacialis]|uniref:Uncharacterized protein n=1 Tax=Polarella glacialis TaxID=89957 RepID=A0A813J2M8_POLGL|nr:unnamed protein product [Polarella glacialis]
MGINQRNVFKNIRLKHESNNNRDIINNNNKNNNNNNMEKLQQHGKTTTTTTTTTTKKNDNNKNNFKKSIVQLGVVQLSVDQLETIKWREREKKKKPCTCQRIGMGRLHLRSSGLLEIRQLSMRHLLKNNKQMNWGGGQSNQASKTSKRPTNNNNNNEKTTKNKEPKEKEAATAAEQNGTVSQRNVSVYSVAAHVFSKQPLLLECLAKDRTTRVVSLQHEWPVLKQLLTT